MPPDETEEPPLPKARLWWWRYRLLGQLWWLVSPVALWLILRDRPWLAAPSFSAALQEVRLEQWIALILLLAHPWFLWRSRGPVPPTEH